MIKTTTLYIPDNEFTSTGNPWAIAKVKRISSTKDTVILTIVSVVIALLIVAMVAIFDPGAIKYAINAFIGGITAVFINTIWRGICVERAYTNRVHQNLNDEAMALCKSLKEVRAAQELYPESHLFQERAAEYGRLAFVTIQKMEKMSSVDVGRSTNTAKHNFINKVQIEAKNLAQSGMDLADLIATQHAESIAGETDYLGIKQYTDAISIEMATYRALEAGPQIEEVPEYKPGKVKAATTNSTSKKSGGSGKDDRSKSERILDEILDDLAHTTKVLKEVESTLSVPATKMHKKTKPRYNKNGAVTGFNLCHCLACEKSRNETP